jgi:hypothetical protein
MVMLDPEANVTDSVPALTVRDSTAGLEPLIFRV